MYKMYDVLQLSCIQHMYGNNVGVSLLVGDQGQ